MINSEIEQLFMWVLSFRVVVLYVVLISGLLNNDNEALLPWHNTTYNSIHCICCLRPICLTSRCHRKHDHVTSCLSSKKVTQESNQYHIESTSDYLMLFLRPALKSRLLPSLKYARLPVTLLPQLARNNFVIAQTRQQINMTTNTSSTNSPLDTTNNSTGMTTPASEKEMSSLRYIDVGPPSPFPLSQNSTTHFNILTICMRTIDRN